MVKEQHCAWFVFHLQTKLGFSAKIKIPSANYKDLFSIFQCEWH